MCVDSQDQETFLAPSLSIYIYKFIYVKDFESDWTPLTSHLEISKL